jgi:hypothetical protein
MSKVTGQILRLFGLLIEMLGVWGVVAGSREAGAPRLPPPAGHAIDPAWIAVAAGFLIWLFGTYMIHGWSHRPRHAVRTGEDPENR